MNASRKTEITVVTHRVLMIRARKRRVRAQCDGCGKQVEMSSAEEAAMLASVSSRVIYRWLETGRLHFSETAEGLVLVCLDSLNLISLPRGNAQAE